MRSLRASASATGEHSDRIETRKIPVSIRLRRHDHHPNRNFLGVFQAHPHSDRPEDAIIAHAVRNPIGAPRLRELIRPGERVLLLPDDVTCATPTHRILPYILEELAAAGVPDEDIRVLISLGTHRRMTEAELTAKLGPLESAHRYPQSREGYLPWAISSRTAT